MSGKAETEPKRRRLELAVAVAQENLMATHVDHALHMVDVIGDAIPFDETLDIYTRMMRLSAGQDRIVTTRALATLGGRTDGQDESAEPDENESCDDPEESKAGKSSFFGQLRHRLRGRINEELRATVRMLTGRAEAALLARHVENGLEFVALFEPDDSASDAVDLYIDALEVRDSLREVVYHLVLARLADERLPVPAPLASGTASPDHPVERAAAADGEHGLRIVSGEGD